MSEQLSLMEVRRVKASALEVVTCLTRHLRAVSDRVKSGGCDLMLVIALALAAMPGAEGSDASPTGTDALTWPAVVSLRSFEIGPDAERRVGVTLGPKTRGCRVVVEFTAVRFSETATGYTNPLAIEVNGEVMGLNIAGRPRLLNRPMEYRFGPGEGRVQVSGRKGVLGLIECQGSARWMLPATPSLEVLRDSVDYAPHDGLNPAHDVIEISDLVYPESFNYLMVKNEADTAPIRFTDLHVRVESKPSLPVGPESLRQAYRRLEEKYLGRSAVAREPSAGREWVYDMDLVESNYSGSDTLAEIETLADARSLVSRHKANGYTALIVSGLHFRYSYLPLWETRILPYMRHLTQAAHEAGLKVIDHYDVPIFFSGGYPFLLEGDHLDWTQRDLRYGTPTRMYCINNPDFRKHYFAWAQRVQRECGIDAYQIDEVYFFNENYCGCEHCRRKFREDTGFELPRNPDSPALFNDASALWRLFNLWREVSLQQFRRDFLTAVRKENPAALLSNYTSTYNAPSRHGGLWPTAFVSYATGTEAMSRVPLENYHEGIADMRLRTGLADAFEHATWVLWYPLTSSAARFCWGLSQATGQAQWHLTPMAGAVRDLVTWPHKMRKFDFTTFADVALIFSEKSKNASSWTGYYHGMETFGWTATLTDANLQCHTLHEVAVTQELLSRYKVVLLPHVTLIDRENATALETYVRNGGTLVVTGETGMLDDQARPRSDFLLGEMMNLRFVDFAAAPFNVVEPDGRRFTFDRERMLYRYGKRFLIVEPRDPKRGRTVASFVKDGREFPGIVEARYGRGRVFTVAGYLGVSNFESTLGEGDKQIFRVNPDAAAFMGRWLRSVLGNAETLVPLDVPPKTVITSWVRKTGRNELNVHFLNVQDYTRAEDVEVRRREIRFPLVEREMTMLLRRMPVSRAEFFAPDLKDPVTCRIDPRPDGAVITVPAGKMTMYGLLKIHLKGGVR